MEQSEGDVTGSSQRRMVHEDLATTSTIDDIAFRLNHRESERSRLLGKIESHRRKQPDIDLVLEQTRRFFERQKIEAKLLFPNTGVAGRHK